MRNSVAFIVFDLRVQAEVSGCRIEVGVHNVPAYAPVGEVVNCGEFAGECVGRFVGC
jgi:hypothetical protein